jgi:hypothetical protein
VIPIMQQIQRGATSLGQIAEALNARCAAGGGT